MLKSTGKVQIFRLQHWVALSMAWIQGFLKYLYLLWRLRTKRIGSTRSVWTHICVFIDGRFKMRYSDCYAARLARSTQLSQIELKVTLRAGMFKIL